MDGREGGRKGRARHPPPSFLPSPRKPLRVLDFEGDATTPRASPSPALSAASTQPASPFTHGEIGARRSGDRLAGLTPPPFVLWDCGGAVEDEGSDDSMVVAVG